MGPYELHDFYSVLRCCASASRLQRSTVWQKLRCQTGTPMKCILHWLRNFYRRFFQQQFKRSCLPDGPKVGSVTLSPQRRLAHAV